MGFNNAGTEAVAEALARWRKLGLWPRHPVGMNLGKSKITPLEQAADDYAKSLRVLLPYLDFFVINVSSPNTPNLRKLQDKAALDEIVCAALEVRAQAVARQNTGNQPNGPSSARKPLLVKVAPDLTFEALDEIIELTQARQIDG